MGGIDWNSLLSGHPTAAKVLVTWLAIEQILAMLPKTITRASSTVQLVFALILKVRGLHKRYLKEIRENEKRKKNSKGRRKHR